MKTLGSNFLKSESQGLPAGVPEAMSAYFLKRKDPGLPASKLNLFDAVDGLPEREKLLLAFHYYEGLSFGEIGELLGIREEDAMAIHSHAIETLQAYGGSY